MVFKCQEDSFLKEFISVVISCEKAKFPITVHGTKTEIDGYEITLNDTILFPEGGGQPSDHGTLNDQEVYHVVRSGDKAIHYVAKPLQPGERVKEVVDWDRRLDHMQQHSGQHLVSAIIEREFKYKTVSWWLGEETSYIELDSTSITPEQIRQTENIVNELIRAGKEVTVQVYKEDTPEEVFENARSVQGLPDDHVGDIRVITIEDVESNMCCGTHVSNLSQLQVIKLLHIEKSKRKSNSLLHFLVGNRVINRFSKMLDREQKITTILNNGPNEHIELIERLQKHNKVLSKNLQTVLKDVAIYEARKFKSMIPKPQYYTLHRKEAEPDFMNLFLKEVGHIDSFLFLSTGDEKGAGNILLCGNESDISVLGPKISVIMDGKGAANGNRFQAKVSNMANRKKAEQILKEYTFV